MLVIAPVTFFKVIIIKVDVFESTIIDEKHFSTRSEAEKYVKGCSGVVAIIVQI